MSFRIVPLVTGTAPPIALHRPVLLIGRHPECDVRIDSAKISRRHCCVAMAYDRVLIRDLSSRNGVRVNGRLVEEARLQTGDELAIGPLLFRLEQESEPPGADVFAASGGSVGSDRRSPGPKPSVLRPANQSPQPSPTDSDIDLVPIDDI
jgi:pSer/pThr/pTyr-binding forkhead associated (FHA) protein